MNYYYNEYCSIKLIDELGKEDNTRILKYSLVQNLQSLTFKFKSFNFVLQIVTSQ